MKASRLHICVKGRTYNVQEAFDKLLTAFKLEFVLASVGNVALAPLIAVNFCLSPSRVHDIIRRPCSVKYAGEYEESREDTHSAGPALRSHQKVNGPCTLGYAVWPECLPSQGRAWLALGRTTIFQCTGSCGAELDD